VIGLCGDGRIQPLAVPGRRSTSKPPRLRACRRPFTPRPTAKRFLGDNLVLTREDIELLKQLQAVGDRGHEVRELITRVALDRLVRGGYSVARPTGRKSVHYRITSRGRDAIVEHDM
jgi:hypothetical protein